MRVLVDVRHLASLTQSGVGEYTIQLLKALFRVGGHEYLLFSSGSALSPIPQFFPEIQNFPYVRHIHIPMPNRTLNASFLLAGYPSLPDLIREKADMLFAPNLAIFPLPLSLPTVLTVHDMTWNLFPELYPLKMRLWHRAVRPTKLMQQAAAIICPSESTSSDLEKQSDIPANRIHIVPHGVDHARFFSSSTFSQPSETSVRAIYGLPERFILFLGTLEPRKNVRTLIKAVSDYRRQTHDTISLVLAGAPGWKNGDIKRCLQNPEIKTWVLPIRYIHAQDRAAMYRAATVFVWPTLYEGFGLPVLEAMACGTPVITSAVSSIPELTGSSAVLINPYLAADLTLALKNVLSSEIMRNRLSKKGIEQATAFSWSKAAQKTLEIFEHTKSPNF